VHSRLPSDRRLCNMASGRELFEKVESLQNVVISIATGGQATEREYQQLRMELIDLPTVRSRLPRFVRTNRDLKQLWGHMKQKSATYQGRRDYIWSEFGPLLADLEVGRESPADASVAEALATLSSNTVHEAWQRALERRQSDPDGAITSARTLLETVLKHILDDVGVRYEERFDLPKLYKMVSETLNLAPSQQTEAILRQVLGGCTSVVEGVGAMRNAMGDAHGKGKSRIGAESRHAELAVNLAGAVATFLVETWESARQR
jgi:hypothetical protein